MDIHKRVRANAEQLRTDFFRSITPNSRQVVQVEAPKNNREFDPTLTPNFPLTSLDAHQETASVLPEIMMENWIPLNILVQPNIVRLLDELIHMNLAVDRERAAEVMIRLGSKTSREHINDHAEQRERLQEIRERFKSAFGSGESV